MKYLLIILTIALSTSNAFAQETKSRKELRKEKKVKQIEKVNKLVQNKTFTFIPTTALPLSGSTVQLTTDFSAKLNGDTLLSYLPFYGVAYYAEYGNTNSPLSFEKLIEDYDLEKTKNGYEISFTVKQKNDKIDLLFNISELGFASLHVTSTNRQAISFNGRIEAPDEDGR